MKVFDALSQAINLYRRNFVKLFLGAAIFALLLQIIPILIMGVPQSILAVTVPILGFNSFASLPLIFIISLAITLVGYLIYIPISGILSGGFMYFCESIRKGINPAYSLIVNPPRKGSLAAAPFISAIPSAIIMGFAIGLLFLIAKSLLSSLLSRGVSPAYPVQNFLALFSIAFLVIGSAVLVVLVINFFLSFTMFSIVLDRKGVIDAARTSISFVKDNFIETVVLSFLLLIIFCVLGVILMLILSIPALIVAIIGLIPFIGSIIKTIFVVTVGTIIGGLTIPFVILTLMSFYTSLRKQPATTVSNY